MKVTTSQASLKGSLGGSNRIIPMATGCEDL